MSAIFNQQLTPVPTPETQPYWEGLRNKELRLCRCQDCQQFYFVILFFDFLIFLYFRMEVVT